MLTIFPIAEGIPMPAESISDDFMPWLTNSIVVSVIVAALIFFICRAATRNMKLVPEKGSQNLFEALVEGLYDMLEGIVGKHMIARTFPLLATIFIFILVSNWFGLLPGVGTIGFGHVSGPLTLKEMDHPLLRSANSDYNLTAAIALFATALWFWWTMQEIGFVGFLKHTFGPKGEKNGGLLGVFMLFIFFAVGVIELISIAIRPLSLSMRLFGNVFAGENLLHTMGGMGDALPAPMAYAMSIVLPLPFYFLELLVGVVQALVFMLLCAVYIQLSTAHEEEGAHH